MSLNRSDDDSQQRFALGFLFALIALVVSTVVGVVVYQRGIAHAPADQAGFAAAAAATADGAGTAQLLELGADESRVVVEGGVVKFYFATGKADLADGANEALASIVEGVQAGGTAQVSGFHDATGDAARNEELSKQRAMAVRDALIALGVTEDKVVLKKPEQTLGDGSNAQARRVEVLLLP